MTFGATKGRYLCNVLAHTVIWVNRKTELFVYCWLGAHAAFDEMFFPTFCESIGHHFMHFVDTFISGFSISFMSLTEC